MRIVYKVVILVYETEAEHREPRTNRLPLELILGFQLNLNLIYSNEKLLRLHLNRF